MIQVGITGGIGSGKTLVCSIFEKIGVPVYYADLRAGKLMNSDRRLRDEIVRLFGSDVYIDEILLRKLVAERVFGKPELLHKLNALVHPAVRKDYLSWVKVQSASYVIEEAAILFESGAYKFMDITVLIYAPEELRIKRTMKRDGVNSDAVRKRMMHQIDEEEKKKLADEVIINDDTELILPQIVGLHRRILNKI